jgi:hypothetical protein
MLTKVRKVPNNLQQAKCNALRCPPIGEAPADIKPPGIFQWCRPLSALLFLASSIVHNAKVRVTSLYLRLPTSTVHCGQSQKVFGREWICR